MAKLETALSLEQILESMCQLGEQEQRVLAAKVLDSKLESFVEELDDNLSCERAANEGPPDNLSLKTSNLELLRSM